MQRTRPLQEHPELSLLQSRGWREYRVENKRFVNHGASNVTKLVNWFWFDAFFCLLSAIWWSRAHNTRVATLGLIVVMMPYLYVRCNQVLWESVIALPSLGLQLETHRGLPSIPLFVSRRFIPLSALEDFLINEGLHGWNVRYYLVAIQRSQDNTFGLKVAFEHILPHFPVLLEVYHGVHETLFSDSPHASDEH